MTSKSEQTKAEILRAALEVLRESGAEGLTMRGVANACGRKLNNVQYYYKDKAVLLNSLANYHFQLCENFVEDFEPSSGELSAKAQLHEAIVYSLNYAASLSDSCLVFRELWAISTRNEAVQANLTDYYTEAFNRMVEFWYDYPLENRKKAAAILVPYVDGYSIQCQALPYSEAEMANLLTDVIYAVLTKELAE
ncbi:TetR/AcrR family transcriptional regulator [Salinibius halmophilus]|uniref:TetR/AcrR family transcriptional regulator n=1 Tax=Salinibius halmophilus TaxID=1853216 RepID=UPI0013148490|nr:TetR/AcrR family transcriptional regulator [Salinibius halmophilus]